MNDIIRHYDVTGKQCPLYWSPTKFVSKAIADGRFTAFKEKVSGLMKSVSDEDTEKLYYVQVGAFRSKSNAEAFLLTVREQYPSAFIKVM